MIIADGKATLHELNTVYTLEDAFKLAEISLVQRHAEYIANKKARKESKRRR